ncbi:MAG: DUF882 domain-containing protein [Caulobacteraceae bacterium]|nr:DUF882 domain-containing protein [Caulobacteraceae bacterium]
MTFARRQILTAGLSAVTTCGAIVAGKGLLDRLIPADLREPAKAAPASIASDDTDVRPPAPAEVRRIFAHNTHTGEVLNAVYYEAGRYIPDALAAAKHVLRDWRNGQQHFMDPHLFDLLHNLRIRLGTNQPFQIWSGYRSPATNAMLHARSEQVASKSQHLLGKAVDITVEGVDLAHLHRAALSLRGGGVGFYPESGFVHVDVGRVREWAAA